MWVAFLIFKKMSGQRSIRPSFLFLNCRGISDMRRWVHRVSRPCLIMLYVRSTTACRLLVYQHFFSQNKKDTYVEPLTDPGLWMNLWLSPIRTNKSPCVDGEKCETEQIRPKSSLPKQDDKIRQKLLKHEYLPFVRFL